MVAWVRAAPFPAHLVVQSGHHRPSQGAEPGGHHTVAWQEYPVALHPNNNSGADFRPILPGTDHGLYNKGFFEGDILRKSAASSSSDTDAGAGRTDPEVSLSPIGTPAVWNFVSFKDIPRSTCTESIIRTEV